MSPALTSDALSPMLVKELRQGTRSRSFMIAMVGLQLAAAVTLCIRAIMAGEGEELESADIAYWIGIAAPLLLIMPWNALMGVQDERKAQTLELLHLTSLTPWRLIFGKWVSLMSRSLVLLSGIAPYFLVRYFMGGVNVALEGVLLVVLVLVAALATAIGLYLSAFRLALARWGLGLLLLFVVGMPTLLLFIFAQERGDQLLDAITWPLALTTVSAFALTTCYFLCAAAGLLAPEAVSYEPAKRVSCLLVMGLITRFAFLAGTREIAIVNVCVAVIAGLDALCAAPRINRSLFRPFARFGLAGRVAGRLLYPGWPSATLFVLLAFTLYAVLGAVAAGPSHNDFEEVVLHFALAGGTALLSAWAAVLLVRPDAPGVDAAALLVLAVQIALGIGVLMAGHSMRGLIPAAVLGVLPGTALFVFETPDESVGTLAFVLALSLAVLIGRSLGYWRRVGEVERRTSFGLYGPAGARA